MDPEIVCYNEQPVLWDDTGALTADVWPEYNQHGQTLNRDWMQLYDIFPARQFVLSDPGNGEVLAEGHTIPVACDGTDPALGPGIDATIEAGFRLPTAGGQPTTLCALAAEIPRATAASAYPARCCGQWQAWPAARDWAPSAQVTRTATPPSP